MPVTMVRSWQHISHVWLSLLYANTNVVLMFPIPIQLLIMYYWNEWEQKSKVNMPFHHSCIYKSFFPTNKALWWDHGNKYLTQSYFSWILYAKPNWTIIFPNDQSSYLHPIEMSGNKSKHAIQSLMHTGTYFSNKKVIIVRSWLWIFHNTSSFLYAKTNGKATIPGPKQLLILFKGVGTRINIQFHH